jgi:hypothetical protein
MCFRRQDSFFWNIGMPIYSNDKNWTASLALKHEVQGVKHVVQAKTWNYKGKRPKSQNPKRVETVTFSLIVKSCIHSTRAEQTLDSQHWPKT